MNRRLISTKGKKFALLHSVQAECAAHTAFYSIDAANILCDLISLKTNHIDKINIHITAGSKVLLQRPTAVPLQ
jgi:hypothetical protein